MALGKRLAAELFEHRARSPFDGDDERVFCSVRGTAVDHKRYAATFRDAPSEAKVDGYVRPFHDLRHSAITNDAAAGSSPIAVMAKAGHRSMSTTKTYLHLAGVVFRDEAAALERRLLGGSDEPTQESPVTGRKFYPSELTSADLASSERLENAV